MARALLLSRRVHSLARLLHGAAANPRISTSTIPSPSTTSSRGLHQESHDARTLDSIPLRSSLVLTGQEATSDPEIEVDEDEPMNEFLSRFVWKMKKKICEAYPGIDRPTRDGMLLVIAERVVTKMERAGGGRTGGELLGLSGSAYALAGDPSVDLSPQLWLTAWEVSGSVLEDMRKMRKRELMKRFLHSENVKGMCRFAAEVGIRGDMLREFRFKWALEEMEEWEFHQGLQRLADEAHWREDGEGQDVGKPGMTSLPERRGRIGYTIHGLDLSHPKWMEVTDRALEAENKIDPEETKPIMGKCKLVNEKILGLNVNEDILPLLQEWKEILEPNRADWMALLGRIKESNSSIYLKVMELVLDEESFQTNIRDYSRMLEIHSKAGRIEEAERILKRMGEKGIKPDILVSVILIHMYCNVGNLGRALEEFESIRKQGFEADDKIYCAMARAYLNAGQPRKGEELMREMETLGMKPPKEIYMELLRAFAKAGQVDGAQRIVNTMQFSGIPQTLESHKLLIDANGRAGFPDQARNTFDYMLKSGQKPDDQCTASMITAYEKKNLLDKALSLLLDLEKDGITLGIATYSVLVDWLGRLLLVDEVEQILEKIMEKGDLPFDIHVSLCDMYSRANIEDKALRSLKILLAKKERLNGVEFERIIKGLLAGRFTEEAKRVHEVMEAQGLVSSDSTKVALMAAETFPQRKSWT